MRFKKKYIKIINYNQSINLTGINRVLEGGQRFTRQVISTVGSPSQAWRKRLGGLRENKVWSENKGKIVRFFPTYQTDTKAIIFKFGSLLASAKRSIFPITSPGQSGFSSAKACKTQRNFSLKTSFISGYPFSKIEGLFVISSSFCSIWLARLGLQWFRCLLTHQVNKPDRNKRRF